MKTKTFITIFSLIFLFNNLFSQNYKKEIRKINNQISVLNKKRDSLAEILENLKLKKIQNDILTIGVPELKKDELIIKHKAYCLVYSEKHEQAKWVSHIITTDIIKGNYGRTNDFRPDSLIKTGSTVEKDFFLKYLKADSTYEYDGFGFDRGHLAPSADFRWSKTALSESYFYSNMSPQRPDFNRSGWAKLEDLIRAYVYERNTALIIVTGPVLTDTLQTIERSINKVSIPDFYYKVALDTANKKGIGFIMPNKELEYPAEYYAKTIDEVENFTGLNFFHKLPDEYENKVERQKEIKWWLPERQKGDVSPINPENLPRNCFNSVQAKLLVNTGDKAKICGTVVSTYKSSKGNVFLNIDKQYPNQIFTVTIFANNLINFSYKPEKYLMGKQICLKGLISEYNGVPSMIVENENQISYLNERR